MATWLPIIKVVLPYVAPIIQVAIPAFNKKKSERVDPLVTQQITELQEAVNTNTESTRSLARAVEEAARANDKSIRQAHLTAAVAIGIAALAIIIAMAAWIQ